MPVIQAPPLLLAAEPPGTAFPARGWKRDFKRVLAVSRESYTLHQDVEEKLLKLMAEFGLNYGAIDIILTPDGRHIFLEVNPVGEFFWLERCPGLPISQAIAQVLQK